MSMNRFVGLGIFALSSSILVTIAACDDSATNMQVQQGVGGSSVNGQGGASNPTTNTNVSRGGTAPGNGGTTGTSTGTPGACSPTTNIIAEAASSTNGNWIGGDPASAADNPCGVQGAIYAYSDMGLDKAAATGDESISMPADDPAATDPNARMTPCAGGKCCISGTTKTWPMTGTPPAADYTASVWGGGIGISLGDPGGGGVKQAYAGTATGFNVTISGTLNGQVLRIGYTQTATDTCAPFTQVTAVGTVAVPFTGKVTCPTWTCNPTCVSPGTKPFDLQVQVVGGDAAGAFNICIDSVTPM